MAEDYKDLVVWQKAMQLAKLTYRLVKLLPREERYAMSDQMRRAAVSIPSNIAEGNSRLSTKEYVNFLSIARGSNAELQTQCLLCVELSYITQEQANPLLALSDEVSRMLKTIISKL